MSITIHSKVSQLRGGARRYRSREGRGERWSINQRIRSRKVPPARANIFLAMSGRMPDSIFYMAFLILGNLELHEKSCTRVPGAGLSAATVSWMKHSFSVRLRFAQRTGFTRLSTMRFLSFPILSSTRLTTTYCSGASACAAGKENAQHGLSRVPGSEFKPGSATAPFTRSCRSSYPHLHRAPDKFQAGHCQH